LAVETGIAPLDLVETPNEILESMIDYMNRRSEAQRKANRKK
jgi:hypothetical protein